MLTLTATVGGVTLSLSAPHPPGPPRAVAGADGAPRRLRGGAGDDPVELSLAGGKGVARWSHRGVPRALPFVADEPHDPPPEPDSWSASCPRLLLALAECGRSAARTPGRFALDRVQVRGKAGQVVGTDGKFALVASGLALPFAGDLLLPPVPALALKDLASQAEVSVALAGNRLGVRAGPWTIWMAREPGRFPDVEAITPRPIDPATLELDDSDALALLDALPGLPGGGAEGRPVTLELGGVGGGTVRAADAGGAAEVRLARSAASGPAGRVALDRAYLARALSLGCRSARLSGDQKPAAFEGGGWLALAMPLDASLATPPCPAAHVLAPTTPVATRSPPLELSTPSSAPRVSLTCPRSEPVEDRVERLPADPTDRVDRVAGPARRGRGRCGRALAESTSRAARLVAALRHHRRRERAVESALSGPEVAHRHAAGCAVTSLVEVLRRLARSLADLRERLRSAAAAEAALRGGIITAAPPAPPPDRRRGDPWADPDPWAEDGWGDTAGDPEPHDFGPDPRPSTRPGKRAAWSAGVVGRPVVAGAGRVAHPRARGRPAGRALDPGRRPHGRRSHVGVRTRVHPAGLIRLDRRPESGSAPVTGPAPEAEGGAPSRFTRHPDPNRELHPL